MGQYTQVDPIGLVGGNPTLYGYVFNPFVDINPFGLIQRCPNTNTASGREGAISGNSYDINKLVETRSRTNPSDVRSIREANAAGGPNTVPPIRIHVHDGRALVIDGHHRLEAFR